MLSLGWFRCWNRAGIISGLKNFYPFVYSHRNNLFEFHSLWVTSSNPIPQVVFDTCCDLEFLQASRKFVPIHVSRARARVCCVWVRGPVFACASVALLTPHAKRMHHIMLSSVARLGPLHFSILCYKWDDFRKTIMEHKMCVSIFSATFVCNILGRIQRGIVVTVHRPSCKAPIILDRF